VVAAFKEQVAVYLVRADDDVVAKADLDHLLHFLPSEDTAYIGGFWTSGPSSERERN